MRGLLLIGLATLAAWPVAVTADAEPSGASPLAGAGVANRPNYSPEELDELGGLESIVQRFEQGAKAYREETRKLLEFKYKQKRNSVFNAYEQLIVDLEGEQRKRRDSAIAQFEAFVQRYPDDGKYTPDAMFRLSELYFERSYDSYFRARQDYEKTIDAWEPDTGEVEPTEPTFHYEPTIAMMQRLIVEFPRYRLVDGAYYLLGYCLGEQGEDERAVDVYHDLVARRPSSRFAAEVWTRIGEYYFDTNELANALNAYSRVLGHPESPFYDKALYKLAWTHYRLADPERSPEEFQKAVDTFVALLDFNERTRAEGKERGGDLRKESIQYIAISYADEKWGGTEKLLAHLETMGGRPYDRELLTALGDVYFDQTRFDEAITMYEHVQGHYPEHEDAPRVQEQIILAHERNRNFESAAAARVTLTKNYSEGTDWYQKNSDNERAIRKAADLTQKSLYSAALFHHKQAQIHRSASKIDLAKEEYQKAADQYGEYLRRFPHDRQLYDLTFYYAESLYYSLQFQGSAVEYAKVRDSNVDNKFLDDAAFSVILSYENAVKVALARGELEPVKALKSAERPEGEKIAPKEVPEVKKALIGASDRYASLLPNSDKLPNILYKAAEILYTYDHLEEARQRFEALLQAYPQHEVAEYASNLIIESHLSEGNFQAVETFTRGLLERPATPGRKEFKSDLVKFKSGAMFKIADDLAAQDKHEEAAAQYLKLLDENPDNEFADRALNNAAVAYEQVSRFESASRLYERLVTQYPKSDLADRALFRVGLNAERFFDFEKAIGAYLNLIDKYPKSDRRADSIYNAALSLENTQAYEESAKQYLRYCQLFPKREDAPQVCFRAGAVYEKMDDPKRVISTYRNYVRRYRKASQHQDRIVEAHLRIAKAYEKLGKERDAVKSYGQAVKVFSKSADEKSAPFAAEAQFQLVERSFKRFAKIEFTGSMKQQKNTLTKKAKSLKSVEDQYKAILGFKQIDWTLASLFRIGQLYQDFAEKLIASPCPKEIKREARRMGATAEEVCDEYRVLLEEKAAGIEDKAVLAFETTITRAREFQVVNKWTKQTLVQLNKLRRAMWPLQKEAKYHLDDGGIANTRLMRGDGKAWEAPKPEPKPKEPVPAAEPPQGEPEAAPPVEKGEGGGDAPVPSKKEEPGGAEQPSNDSSPAPKPSDAVPPPPPPPPAPPQ